MPDVLDDTGLTLKTLPEITAELVADFQAIYGADINTDPDTPDGQIIGISAQVGIDLRELIAEINSSFDPDQARGTVLDQRVALNNIQRKGGTFTRVPVQITTDRAINLAGLDGDSETLDIPSGIYTIKDNAGTQFVLLESQEITQAGMHELLFRAAQIGNVAVTIGIITIPVTILAGITMINNVVGATTQGQDEESDTELRLRRARSTTISAMGYLDSIESALSTINGVTSANVYENTDAGADADGIPGHGIWAIVEGGADADIGAMIYSKKAPGEPMKGSISVNVPRSDGVRHFPAKFDRPTDTDLYIKFSLAYSGGAIIVDTNNLKTLIVANILWGVGEEATNDRLIAFVKSLNNKYIISGMLLSLNNSTWTELITPPTKASRFINDVSRISIS